MGKGNFGTCLQSFALNRILQQKGYDVSFLAYLPPSYSVKSKIKYIIHILGLEYLVDLLMNPSQRIQITKLRKFQKPNFKVVRAFTEKQELRLEEEFDCFLTGSDQIWNTYYSLYNRKFFLSFIKEKKRIAYASSIGTNGVKENCKEDVKHLLLQFCHIGVREAEAVKVLSALTGRGDIQQVLDPTFLLRPEEWACITKDATYEFDLPEEYIFCYFIGNNPWYAEQLKDVSKRYGIDNIIIVPSTENPMFSIDNAIVYRYASPVEFVDLIRNSKLVCTDSFHATALSINHSVPFVEFMRFQQSDKKSQNSRIQDLLKHYDLTNRVYNKEFSEWAKTIDYLPIQNILARDRKRSMDYLINAIEY